MGLFDRSSSTTQNLEQNENRPITITDSDYAQVIEAGGDVYAVNTDYNAIDRATELAARSLDVGESIVRDGLRTIEETSRMTTNAAVDLGEGAFDLAYESQYLNAQVAGRAVQSAEFSSELVADFSSDALFATSDLARGFGESTERLAGNVQDQAGDFLNTTLEFTRGLQTKFQDTISSTVDAIQRIGVEQNKSTDQRLAESTETTLKYALIALGVMALGLVGFAATRR
jgi:hypothetical protein